MTQWVTFTAIVTLLTAAMVGLSLLTQRSITPIRADSATHGTATSGPGVGPDPRPTREPGPASDDPDSSPGAVDASRPGTETAPEGPNPATESNRRAEEAEPKERALDSASSRRPFDADPNREAQPDRKSGDRDGTPDATRGVPGPSTRGSGRVVASVGGEPVTTRGLLVNVTVTQALFLGLVIAALVLADVPVSALGIELAGPALSSGLALGLGAGLGLYGASEVGSGLGRRFGADHDEWLRESLAPSSARGWVVLFVGVLPLIAVFEEVLFRGVLIGALSVGFGLSPWLLAVASSVLFAVGHGIQGTTGIVVTGVIGFVLAAVFVVTGSLLTVVVAHYVLNACEFAVHEGLGIEPLGSNPVE